MMTAFAILLVLLVYSVYGNGNGSFELQKEQRFKNHVIGGGQVTTTQSEIREGNHVQTDLFTKQLVKFKNLRRSIQSHETLSSVLHLSRVLAHTQCICFHSQAQGYDNKLHWTQNH